jgi:hypothetical protein
MSDSVRGCGEFYVVICALRHTLLFDPASCRSGMWMWMCGAAGVYVGRLWIVVGDVQDR